MVPKPGFDLGVNSTFLNVNGLQYDKQWYGVSGNEREIGLLYDCFTTVLCVYGFDNGPGDFKSKTGSFTLSALDADFPL